jgi:hypothetical protein
VSLSRDVYKSSNNLKADTNSFEESVSMPINVASNTKIVLRNSRKVHNILALFDQIWNFSTDFHRSGPYNVSENLSIASCSDACGQTGMKQIGTSSDYANAHKDRMWQVRQFYRGTKQQSVMSPATTRSP